MGKALMPGGFTPPGQMERNGGPKLPAAVWAAEQNAAKAAIEKLRAGE